MDASHPVLTTAVLALAVLNQRMGDHAAVEHAVRRALVGHRRLAGVPTQANDRFFAAGAIAGASARFRLDIDSDADWLSDLFETILGLDPANPDSDLDGVSDLDERIDGQVNRLAIPLCVDPTKIIAHEGPLDPIALGFSRVREFPGSAVVSNGTLPLGAWKALTSTQGYYRWLVSASFRRAAVSRGWMITSTGVVHDGGAIVNVDLGPEGARFDVNVIRSASGTTTVRLNTTAVPWEGLDQVVSQDGHWPISQLVYSSTARSASFFVGDRLAFSGYVGHRQFQEGHGFFFGSHTMRGQARSGDVDFGLAALIVR
jgi:hypothetical protein